MSQKPQLPTPASVDRQLQAVLALAEINRQVREGLRARFVERQAQPTANGCPFTMRRLAVEVGCSWEFVRHAHDGSKAFGVSNSGELVIKYLGLEKEWGPVKAACSEAALADAMVSIALFPVHLIRLVFKLKKTFIVAREQHEATMADVAQALNMSSEDFESLYYGKNALVEAIDPNHDATGERYLALLAKLDDADLMDGIARVSGERRANVQRMRAEIDALRDRLLAHQAGYSSEMDISSKLLGRSGALASLRGDEGFSIQRHEAYKQKLTAELSRLDGKKGGVRKAPPAPPVMPTPPVPEPPPVAVPSVAQFAVGELVDATERALIGAMRLGIASLKNQLTFLMHLPDKDSERFRSVWLALTDEIEDLRLHLQAVRAETSSGARDNLARLLKERAAHSITKVMRR